MPQDINRHRGGQPGNRNACKHGFYSSAFTGHAKAELIRAAQITGLDAEIALIRARLKALIQQDPDNLRLISEAASTLARLMRTSQKCGLKPAEDFSQVKWRMLYDLGSQLGLNVKQIAAEHLGLEPENQCPCDQPAREDTLLNESPHQTNLDTKSPFRFTEK